MKSILTAVIITLTVFSYGQTSFYKADGSKIKVIGEQTTLMFNHHRTLRLPPKTESASFSETLIASLLPSIIDLGFKISSDVIEKNLLKYTNEFSGRNTYINNNSYLSSFELSRKLLIKGETEKLESFRLSVIPIELDTKTFYFAIDNIMTSFSGAKTKKDLSHNDYTIEIKLTYFDGKEKKEQSSSPITVSLVRIGQTDYEVKKGEDYLYISDKFPITDDPISEISIKIIETNSGKVQAEKVKASYDKYSDDIKEGAKNVINFYIEKSKESDEDESESK